MDWNECYPRDLRPERAQIDAFIGNPQWTALVAHLEGELGIRPLEEHSRCSGAPGWNLKYRKGGRALALHGVPPRGVCNVPAVAERA